MINMKKESLAVLCGNQPIMAFVLLFCMALAGATIFSDIFSVSFWPGSKYGLAIILGASGVWGQRKRYKKISEEKSR